MKRLVMMFLAGATLLGSLASAATNYELFEKKWLSRARAAGITSSSTKPPARVYIAHATQV